MALTKAFGGAKACRGCGVRPGSLTSCLGEGCGVTPALGLNGLYLVPFQLQKALQILLQLPDRFRSGGTFALRVEEDGQLPQAPRIERRWQEVWVAVAIIIVVLQHSGSGYVGMEVQGVDHLCSEVELGRSARRGQDRESFGVRQVAGAVCVILLVSHETERIQVWDMFLQGDRMQHWVWSQGQ